MRVADEFMSKYPNTNHTKATKFIWLVLAMVVGLISGAAQTVWAQQSEPVIAGYRDSEYTGGSVTSEPTEEKPESKLWYNDGFWWAIMWDSNNLVYRIHRLDLASQTWINVGTDVDDRGRSAQDVLWDDAAQKLYIASRAKTTIQPGITQDARLYRYSYNATTDTYTLDPGFPTTIMSVKTRALTIVKDSTGQLWATWTDNGKVMVNQSSDDGVTWGIPFILPTMGNDVKVDAGGLTLDISAILAFNGDRIGILWGNQVDKKFYFSVHLDSNVDTSWEPRETALEGPIGNPADDHINVTTTNGTVLAVVKSDINGGSNPLNRVLKRTLSGTWTEHIFGLRSDDHTRPIILFDTDTDSVYVFAKQKDTGIIYYKAAHFNNLNFPSGLGRVFIRGVTEDNVNNPTSTKQTVNASTGIVVLASEKPTKRYFHNYLALGGNTRPIANADTVQVPENTPTAINVLANDVDPAGSIDPTTVMLVDSTKNGSLSIDPVTGVITYTPNPGFLGADSLLYTVKDDDGESAVAARVHISVNTNVPPVANDDNPTTDEDTPVVINVLANDSDSDGLLDATTVTLASNPTNGTATVDGVTGEITYTPNANFFGSDSFTYTVQDNSGATSNVATVNVTINDVNDNPVAGNDAATTNEDTPVTVDVLANDSDVDGTLNAGSVTVTAAPTNGSTSVDAGTGAITYTPDQNFNGTDTFSYTVSDDDGGVSNAATVSITITSVNDAPVAADDSATTSEDTPVAVDVLANDSDIDGTLDVSSVTVVTPPANGSTSVDPVTGEITYTPDAQFSGSDSFSYTVADNDGAVSNVATVGISVGSVNDPPVAADDVGTTDEDTPVVLNVLGNDSDVDGTLVPGTVAVSSGPANGSATVNSTTGEITYTPNPNFNGSDSFTYTVNDNDGATSNAATVSITVNPVNDAPVAQDDAATTNEDTPVDIDVTLNDSDVEGSLNLGSVTVVSAPSNGTTTVNTSNGVITYTPNQDFVGSDSFTYTVDDNQAATSNTATVLVTVNAVNDPPTLADDATTTAEDNAVVIDVLANDQDVDGTIDPTTVSITTPPTNGVAVVNSFNGLITYTPTQDFFGNDTFEYTVDDNQGATAAPATVTVTVTPVNDPPVATDDAASTDEDTPVAIDVLTNDNDVDGTLDPATVTVVSAPSFGSTSVDPATGQITYTPNPNFVGSDSFTYQVSDNDGAASNTATVTVNVSGTNDPPTAVDDAVSTDEDTSVDIDVVANDSDVDGSIDITTVTIDSPPASGTATAQANGFVTYVPNANFNGTDTFTYFVHDNLGAPSNVATVTVTVNSVNDAPVAAADAASTTENQPVTVDVLANDSDVDGTLVTSSVTVVSGPTNGTTAIDPATGAVTYTPNTGFSGTDSFLYTVTDNDGAVSNQATVTITLNALPVAVDDNALTTEDVPVAIDVLANDSDSDGSLDASTVQVVSGPSNGTTSVNPTTGEITYDPAANFFGTDSFTYNVADNQGARSNTATVTVTVNRAPIAVNDAPTTDEDVPIDIDILNNDLDLDGTLDPSSVNILSNVTNGTTSLNPTTGVVTYTPNPEFSGTDSFTYTVNDNLGSTSNVATVSITVNNVNDLPVAVDDAATTGEDTPVDVNVLANDSDVDGTIDATTVTVVSGPTNGTTSVNPANGVITYTPDTNFFGTDTFTYTVNDDLGATSNAATVTINVAGSNDPPVAGDDVASTDENASVDIDVTLNDTDVDGNIVPSTVTIVTAPANGSASVNSSTGVVTYTPNNGFAGSDSFTYTVQDNDGLTSNVATVNIAINDLPFAGNDAAETHENQPVDIDVTANDTDADGTIDVSTVTILAGPIQGSGSIDPATGVVTYTPNPGFSGTDTFIYTVNDNDGGSSNQATVLITVNDLPVANDDVVQTNEDTPLNIDVIANDTDSDGTLDAGTVSIVSPASNGTTSVDPATGVVTYTPNAEFFGSDAFTYTVNDNKGATSNTATVSITVAEVNDPPVANDDAAATAEDTPVTIDVKINDTDIDGTVQPTSVAVVTPPANGSTSVDGVTGVITYTPNQNFFGSDSFTYTINDDDGATSNPATVTVNVTGDNDPPTAVDDAVSTNEDTPIVIDPAANDTDVDGTVQANTVTIVTNVTNGTTSVDPATGEVTYTPSANFFGTDAFTYQVQDDLGAISNVATVNITVNSVNDAPVAVDDSTVTQQDAAVDIDVTANDTDVDGTVNAGSVLASAASNGTIAVLPGGIVRYTPLSGFTGNDSFKYTVKDNEGLVSNEATVRVFVNRAPTAVNDVAVVHENQAGTIDVLSNDSDSDGTLDPATVTVTSAPSNGTASVDPATGAITYTPNNGFVGADAFSYTVQDNNGGTSNAATVSVTVNDLPVAVDDSTFTHANTPVDLDVVTNDTDSDGNVDPTTVAITNAPNNGTATVDANTGVVTYTPNQNFFGVDIFLYTVNDDRGGTSNTGTVKVAVNAFPVANDDAVTTSEDTPVNINVAANDTDPDGSVDPTSVTIVTDVSNGTTAVDPVTGIVTYTPAQNFSGVDTFTYTVNDNHGATSNVATVTIDIGGVNDPPVANDDAVATGEDTPVDINVTANDTDLDGTIDVTTVTVVSPPSNGTTAVNPASGVITYSPNLNFQGTDSFTYNVADNGGLVSNTATVTVTVAGDNDPPVAVNDTAFTQESTPVVVDVAANDTDVDGSVVATTVAVQTQPANGTASMDPATGLVTYTPNAGFSGTDTFTYTIQDDLGLGSNAATVVITVNDAPVANDDAATTPEETPVVIDVAANDTDSDGTVVPTTVTIVTAPTNGSASVDPASGEVTYTPDANFEGTDTFTYTVQDNDGGTSNAGTVTITVTGSSDPPIAQDDAVNTDEDVPVAIDVLANDSDPDQGDGLDPTTVAVQNQPANGSVAVDPSTGIITYTPNLDFVGGDSFTYTVQDNTGLTSNVATVSVTVGPVNDPPVAQNDVASTEAGTPVTINVLVNDFDSDGTIDPTTVAIASAPFNGTVSVNPVTGEITYTPNAGFGGSDAFTYTVSDNNGMPSNPATVTVNVSDKLLPTDDTFVRSERPTNNYGSGLELRARKPNSGNIYIFIKFVVNGLTGPVQSAKVRLYVQDGSDDGGTIRLVSNNLRNSTTPWTEDNLIWDNAPELTGNPIDALPGPLNVGDIVEYDVSSVVTGNGTYSFAIRIASSDALKFDSKEAANPPELVIDSQSTSPLAPTITSFSPTLGPVGTEVTITGTNLSNVTSVAFNGISAATFTADSDTQLRATVPTGATKGKITATNPSGVGTSNQDFTVVLPPSIASFTPTSGPVGTTVIITGNNFDGVTDVAFNGTSATNFTVNSSTQISADVPAGASTGPISVTNAAGTAASVSNFTFIEGPVITSFTPTSGPVGAEVTITGSKFTGITQVAFNGTPASSFTVDSETQIRANVPNGATTGPVSVTNAAATAISTQDFTVEAPPVVSSFAPAGGTAGTEVTITGGNFSAAINVAFNGTSAASFTIDSDTQIRATVPAGATTGPISVVNNVGTGISLTNFVITPPPTVSGFTPSEGTVGTEVTINGSNFLGATDVTFNGVSASSFFIDSDTQIRATVPLGASTGKVSVFNVAGPGQSVANFIVLTGSATLTFQPTDDAYVRSSAPNDNFGFGDVLRGRLSNSGVKQHSYLKFNVTGVVGPVSSAKLRLVVRDASVAGGSVYSVSNNFDGTGTPWTEDALTFNNAPQIPATPLSSVGGVTLGQIVEFDVTSAVTGNGVFSFAMKNDNNDAVEYESKENANPPQLIVETAGGSVNAPVITSFTPNGGVVGTEVTIAGSNFLGTTDVSFNGISAASFTVDSDAQIRAVVNAGTTTGKISATNADGTGLSVDVFTIVSVPTISSFSPTAGPFGTEVTILGSNFTGTTQVTFNGLAAASFSVDSDTQIRATVPNGAATGPIAVQNAAGTTNSSSNFTVLLPPTVTGFTPANGPVGTEVTVTGTGFSGATAVAFNGAPASGFSVDSDTQIRATVPSGATTGPISVSNAAGTGISSGNFTVEAPPVVTSFSPTAGVAGTEVTILGGNFSGALNVSFNGTAATVFTVDSDTQIRATVPAGATTGPVSVTNSIGTGISTTNFTIVSPPTIGSFSPNNGPVGTEVVIQGNNFTGTTTVSFNGTPASSFTVDSDSQIRATVPNGATTGPISVSNAAGTGTSANNYTVTNPPSTITLQPIEDSYVHSGRPTRTVGNADELRVRLSSADINSYLKFNVTGLSGPPQSATLRLFVFNDSNDGGSVYLVSNNFKNSSTPWDEDGLNFNNAPEISGVPLSSAGNIPLNQYVEFDVTSAITGNGIYSFALSSVSNDLANYYSKEGPNPPELVIEAGGGSSNLPTVTSFAPVSGPVGTEVTLDGFNFTGTNAVSFNGVAATQFTVDSDNQIRATVPAGASSGPISVTSGAGTGNSSSNFTVLFPPVISSFTPTNGPVGTAVTISGSNFTGVTAVAFNGTAAGFTVLSGTEIATTVPAGATTGPISVTNADGTAASSSNFAVNNAPVITFFSPTTGPHGTSVTINGSNFTGVTDVAFNGLSAIFTVNTATQIVATVPNGATTGKVSVTNADGTGNSAQDFIVVEQPQITSFTPASGAPGTEVTISGTHFTGVTSVTFNGTPASTIAFDSDAQVRATVPAGATTGPISVSNVAGTGVSATNFVVAQGSSTLTFNPTDDAYVRSSRPTENFGTDTILKVRETSSVDRIAYLKFNVTGVGGTVQRATLRLKALESSTDGGDIFSVSNNLNGSGTPWTETNLVWSNAPTISGAPLGSAGAVATNQVVEFDVTAAISGDGVYSFAVENDVSDLVTYSSKEGTTPPELVIETDGGGVTTNPPSITSFAPTAGPIGTEVTINGTNLGNVTAVTFNGTPAASFSIDSNLQIRATVANGTTTGPIVVTNPDGSATSANAFSVLSPPAITSFAPTAGPVGTEVTISGSNFSGLTAVSFNGLAAASFSLDSDSQVRAVVPNGATTGPVSVSNAVGTAVSTSNFTVTNVPGITSFSPASAPVGAEVTITGVNFTGATSVSFNGAAASSFTVDSDTQVRANVPPGATTGPIAITNGDGTGISSSNFTVVSVPTITSFSPTSGGAGIEVTITGTNFVGVTTVTFNGLAASSFTLDSGTQLRVNVPAGATTGPISVTNAAGTGTSSSDFTVVSGGGTFSFLVIEDAYVRSSRPTENFGGDVELKVRTTTSVERNTYLKFVVSGLSAPVQSATLRLFVLDGSDDGGSVYSVSNNLDGSATAWTEDVLVWDNAPPISGAPVGSAGPVTTGQFVEIDVTPAINGNGTFSFAIRNNSSNLANYRSKEGGTPPELIVVTGLTKEIAESEETPEETEVESNGVVLPEEAELFPNYPNPFNIETTISYAVPRESKVKLAIFNVRGQLVRVLVDDNQKAGVHKVRWNGKNAYDQEVSTGVYFMRLEVGDQKFSRKITLQK